MFFCGVVGGQQSEGEPRLLFFFFLVCFCSGFLESNVTVSMVVFVASFNNFCGFCFLVVCRFSR